MSRLLLLPALLSHDPSRNRPRPVRGGSTCDVYTAPASPTPTRA
jgi:hypothetical protein